MLQENEQTLTQIGHYKILKQLGDGVQSEVHLASDEQTGQKVAIKIFNSDYMQLIKKEINMTQKFDHQNIAKYIADGKTQLEGPKRQASYLITEYAPKGCLFDLIARCDVLTEEFSRFYMRQLVEAVKHIYQTGFVHRDLKLENMLLDHHFNLKLIDFGFAGNIKGIKNSGNLSTVLGTLGYMAPEIFLGKPYNGEKVDSFALGVILFIMVFKRPPFGKARQNDRFYKLIQTNKLEAFWKAHCKAKKCEVSTEFMELVNNLLSADPTERLSIEEIGKHAWMAEGNVPSTQELVTEMDKRFTMSCLEDLQIESYFATQVPSRS